MNEEASIRCETSGKYIYQIGLMEIIASSVIDVSIPYFYYVSTGIGKLLVGDQMHFPMKENVYIKNVLDYLECFPKIPLLFLEITPV